MEKTGLKVLAAAMLVACAAWAGAAERIPIKNNFPRPKPAALKALKGEAGKVFNAGWVFIDGKYVPPPYKVVRYGNVIRINDYQVTGEVVPWDEFIKTQEGVKVTKSETPAPGEGAAPAPEPEPEPEPEEEDDSWESSLDDLFDDAPAEKKSGSKKPKSSGYKPRPKKPTVTVTYTFEGEFVPNDTTKQLLKHINDYRTKIERDLRSGGYCCFSSRYPGITADGGAARVVMQKLPDIMKKSATREAFAANLRNAGLVYFSEPLIDDLFRNRIDYLPLSQRNKSLKESSKWDNMMRQ